MAMAELRDEFPMDYSKFIALARSDEDSTLATDAFLVSLGKETGTQFPAAIFQDSYDELVTLLEMNGWTVFDEEFWQMLQESTVTLVFTVERALAFLTGEY